ncbi:MAG: RNA polymerase sporulation sigma factor SigH [Clostridia bacterium]
MNDINNKNTELEILSDEELIELSHEGNREADELLCLRYKNLVKMKVRPYFLMGADKEDIIQEGMIGLFKAIRDYKSGYNKSFKAFAEMCIVRHVMTAITGASNKRHSPLNSYVSLYMTVGGADESEGMLIDILNGSTSESPEDIAVNRESDKLFFDALIKNLTELEYKCLRLYLEGMSYVEIAEKLEKSTKAVDNALQRIRKKIGDKK